MRVRLLGGIAVLGRFCFGLIAGSALLMAAPAHAAPSTVPVDIRAQPLASALQDLARQTGVEMLFDRAVADGIQAPAVRGRLTPEEAIRRLLEGTNLTARRAPTGAWLIVAQAIPPQQLAEPEILVIGRRTQNFDLRRRESDIQPYEVSSGASIIRAHSENVDDYFRTRVTPNTDFVAPTLLETGATNSEIDLRGLGADSTLVLIDGRRMPGLPSSALPFGQPDLNAVPIHSIDRIETLTGTAGGIYGFGALGGVVNVILKRDYRGAELNLTGGISSRGDAGHISIEGRLGFSPDGGRTNIMVYVSQAWSKPLRVGQRNFNSRNLEDSFALIGDSLGLSAFPVTNSVTVLNLLGTNLKFKPQYGGATLGSNHSFLPIGFSGNSTDLVTALTQHSGQTDVTVGPGLQESDMHSNPEVTAGIFNVRHRFNDTIEAYFDGLVFRNHGEYLNRQGSGLLFLPATSPNNPFQQPIILQFPAPGRQDDRINVDSDRFTGGVIVALPRHWRGTAEATFGSAAFDQAASGLVTSVPFGTDLGVFGNWADFQKSLGQFGIRITGPTAHPTNHYQEQLVQLAGPLYRTDAGPGTLTLSLERHRERADAFVETEAIGQLQSATTLAPAHSSTTVSAHAELNSKIFADAAPFFLLKGLELQLAAHFDSQKLAFIEQFIPETPQTRATFSGMAYTAGAKVQPLPWLMVRGSYATGRQPPPLLDLLSRVEPSNLTSAHDPKRGNAFLFEEGNFNIQTDGSPSLSAIRAGTLSLGLVITPFGKDTLRLSIDYSRIRKTHDVFFFTDPQIILDHESEFPTRIMRAPLTDHDKALGYTGGLITGIDATATNGTNAHVDALDARLDWKTPFLGGTLHGYGSATLQIRNVEQGPFGPAVEHVDFLQGPLKWKSNGGLDWSRGSLTIGGNLQFYGRYRVFAADQVVEEELFNQLQGSDWIPSQAYLDLYLSRQVEIGGTGRRHSFNVEFGINNVLDKVPPREASFAALATGDAAYSRFGDPRRRRFEIGLSSNF